jgi:hypothetical protein
MAIWLGLKFSSLVGRLLAFFDLKKKILFSFLLFFNPCEKLQQFVLGTNL